VGQEDAVNGHEITSEAWQSIGNKQSWYKGGYIIYFINWKTKPYYLQIIPIISSGNYRNSTNVKIKALPSQQHPISFEQCDLFV